jgi:hypothetical protein
MLFNWESDYWHSEGSVYPQLQIRAVHDTEDEGTMIFQDTVEHLPSDSVS